MEILEHQQQRLHSAFTYEYEFQCVECPPPALRSVHPFPVEIIDGHIEQRQQRWEGVLESAVQRQELARNLLTYLPGVVPALYLKVAFQKVSDGVVRCRFAIGH